MAWFVVRTEPGAQKPQREYAVETTELGKGYRIVPSLDPTQSAVEVALTRSGFTHYMPAEKRLIRDRLRPYLWKTRRFALMVGYVFIRDPDDFRKLEETPGVAGIVKGMDGRPLAVSIDDILMVRTMEAVAEVEFDRQSKTARQTIRKKAKKDERLRKLVESFDIAGTISVRSEDDIAA